VRAAWCQAVPAREELSNGGLWTRSSAGNKFVQHLGVQDMGERAASREIPEARGRGHPEGVRPVPAVKKAANRGGRSTLR